MNIASDNPELYDDLRHSADRVDSGVNNLIKARDTKFGVRDTYAEQVERVFDDKLGNNTSRTNEPQPNEGSYNQTANEQSDQERLAREQAARLARSISEVNVDVEL